MSASPSTAVDLVGPGAVADPHAVFRELRMTSDVWWLERHKAWLLLGYDDVRAAVSDNALSTDTITPLQRRLADADRIRFKPAADLLAGWMIFNDPPVHTALRAPVRTAFTPKAVAQLEAEVAALVERLLDDVDPAGFDLVRAVAHPLPAIVIAHLLGVPAERHEEFQGWSAQLGALVMGKVSRADAWDRALLATADLDALFTAMIADRRRDPTDDLVTRLVAAADGHGSLSDAQMVGACSLLLFGGHETTTSLITSGALHLLGDNDRQAQLAADPETAVEELLRFDGPSKIVVRRVRDDVEWERSRAAPWPAGLLRPDGGQPRPGRIRGRRRAAPRSVAQPPPRLRVGDALLPRRPAGSVGGASGAAGAVRQVSPLGTGRRRVAAVLAPDDRRPHAAVAAPAHRWARVTLVVHDRDGDVVHVRLNRPERHNALVPEMWQRLARLGAALVADETVRCVVISGEGSSFSSGIDRRALAEGALTPYGFTGEEADRERTEYDERDIVAAQATARWLHDGDFVSIAAVRGFAFGAGARSRSPATCESWPPTARSPCPRSRSGCSRR